MTCKQNHMATQEYKQTVSEALKVLDKKNLALILHGVSFPSIHSQDTGFGTYNSDAAKSLYDYISGVFNALQLGPAGKTKSCDSSPYTGTVFSKNPLFIDLKELTTPKFEKLLSEETFNKIVEENPNKNQNKAAYCYAYQKYEDALKEVYENFKKSASIKMKFKFADFKAQNSFWLDNDALYEALIIENENDYWPNWKSKLDKNLLNTADKNEAKARIKEVQKKHKDVIEKYKLEQFIVDYQSRETLKYAKSKNIKMIADRQVAFSDRDTWAYQSLFKDGWSLGCPPDHFSKDGQAWGFSVVDPEKLFNKNGSLGPAGELLYKLYLKMFSENPGGVRIDHTVGLIDPWVYKKGKLPKIDQGAGRLYSSVFHDELKEFCVACDCDVDTERRLDEEKWIVKLSDEQIKQYGAMLEKIVIKAAKKVGLNKDAIVAEDLGTLTYPVVQVMEKYALQGMKLVQFVVPEEADHPYRCKNITPNSWAMVGTHDNEPIRMWAHSMMGNDKAHAFIQNLMEDLFYDFDNQDEIRHRLYTDEKFLAFAKLVEIFACKAQNVQIFFTDFFGINDVYNRPGTGGDANWSLRLNNDFENLYTQKLESEDALNLPLALVYAIKARGNEFANKNAQLIEKLEKLV